MFFATLFPIFSRPMSFYHHQDIEKKWQDFWEKDKTFEGNDASTKPKYYILDMFPYPSGAGLHVGHPEGYTATDIIARYKRMQGFEVLHPMGWDAFGLPAENYAIKTGTHPQKTTAENIANFTRQIKSLGFSYDWSREIDTTDPKYYQWTQWIFLQIFESYFDEKEQKAKSITDLKEKIQQGEVIPEKLKGRDFSHLSPKEQEEVLVDYRLAYETEMPINWCPSCKTGLANEEVVDGKCDRCQSEVERKNLRQWVLRITKYAERLLKDLESLADWPEKIITMQRNWIGKSEGAEVDFEIVKSEKKLSVYTTRIDTLFSGTFLIMAPEHPLVDEITIAEQKTKVGQYLQQAALKSDLERTELQKEKSGVFTGSYVINPATGKEMPIWIADFVLVNYGTGIVFADAHDERDFEMAKKYNIPLEISLRPKDNELWEQVKNLEVCFSGKGTLINSGQFDDLTSDEAMPQIINWLEQQGKARQKTNYRLRDWIFSRQRYWGEPIPVVHCETCGIVAEKNLPLTLPGVERYEPSGTGESPLVNIQKWVNCPCPTCGEKAKRETNTMPQWAGSSWYYLRFMDPSNEQEFCSKEKERKWGPVDLYVGGAEHAVLHLLYSRFWHKVLFDLGHVSTKEPFKKLMNQGLILAEDGQKMSKSLGNVVNPDEIVEQYGADTLRMYEMFMGPFEQNKAWSTGSVGGMHKFLKKIHTIFSEKKIMCCSHPDCPPIPKEFKSLSHKTIKKVTEDIEDFKFNTAISQMMIWSNAAQKMEVFPRGLAKKILLLLAPFAPHLAEELWSEVLKNKEGISFEPWPNWNPDMIAEEEMTIAVQVNGKLRATITFPVETPKEEILQKAKEGEKVQKFMEGKQIRKEIYVPGKIVNIVVG